MDDDQWIIGDSKNDENPDQYLTFDYQRQKAGDTAFDFDMSRSADFFVANDDYDFSS